MPSLPWVRSFVLRVSLMLLLVACATPAHAQGSTFHVTGKVTSANFTGPFLESPIQVGDTLTGILDFSNTLEPRGTFHVGLARFSGVYPFTTYEGPENFHAYSDISGFGGNLPPDVGTFPDVISTVDVVNGVGFVEFHGLARSPDQSNLPSGGFFVTADFTLSPLVPEPPSHTLLMASLLPVGLLLGRKRRSPV